jgi:hypothetical protein
VINKEDCLKLHHVAYLINKYVLMLSDAIVTFLSSIVVLNPNGSFWIVPLLFAVSGIHFSDQP